MERDEEICPSCAVYRIMPMRGRNYNKEWVYQLGEFSMRLAIYRDSLRKAKHYIIGGACLSIIPTSIVYLAINRLRK
ncbi:hypothetical protein AB4Z29_16475 [Paenibacillus sp. 2TAB23]|uniref:hypothetical protein n=1 Tax=Paenibacillus sp. 2TAB23 TaxID=3233004 RepID=UPI003F9E9DF4